jgi:hypothetical protein
MRGKFPTAIGYRLMTIEKCITVKRLYSKYSHQLDISDDANDPVDPAMWVKINMPGKARSRRHDQGKVSIYCNSDEFDVLAAKYKDRILAVRQPLDKDCERFILDGYHINLRENLYYAKFRYSVQFYTNNYDAAAELNQWITDTYGKDRKNIDYKYRNSKFFPTLYCVDNSMIDMIKLSDPAKVVYISKICTFAEVAATIR